MKRDRTIAELEAKVTTVASDLVNLNDQEYGAPHSLEAGITDEVAIASTELYEYLENQVLTIISNVEHTTEHESQTPGATDYPDPEQKSEYLEQSFKDDCLVEKEQDRESLGLKLQVKQSGNRVEIVSSRQGEELVGLIGDVLVTNTSGCVVEVGGKTKWFCSDEILFVPQATSQA